MQNHKKLNPIMKTVLITGATSGIGMATALKFSKGDFRLILTGRNVERLDELKRQISSQGTSCVTLQFDVRSFDQVRQAFGLLPPDWAQVDILINNAGLALGLEPVADGDPDDWNTMIDTNIKGLLYVTRFCLPSMLKRRHGHIINIGSVAGDAAYAGGGVYCATKAAVKTLSDALRIDLMKTPIRVTNIKPGLVETNFSVTRFHGDRQRAADVYKGIKPLTGDDIAEVIYFAACAPEHVQIAEVLVLATHQANGSLTYRE